MSMTRMSKNVNDELCAPQTPQSPLSSSVIICSIIYYLLFTFQIGSVLCGFCGSPFTVTIRGH